MEHKIDLRIIKTQSNIKNVFIELLYKKEFNKITVQDILDNALINRSTFYRYYSDKYELAEKLINEVISDAYVFINERFNCIKGEELLSIIQRIYEHFYERRKIILALLKIKTENLSLNDDLEYLLKERYINYIKSNGSNKNNSLIDYHATIYASFVLTTLKWLLLSNNESDIEIITQEFKEMFFNRIFVTH